MKKIFLGLCALAAFNVNAEVIDIQAVPYISDVRIDRVVFDFKDYSVALPAQCGDILSYSTSFEPSFDIFQKAAKRNIPLNLTLSYGSIIDEFMGNYDYCDIITVTPVLTHKKA